MFRGEVSLPVYQTALNKTFWVRSDVGGVLKFYVRPGQVVKKGQVIAICEGLFSNKSHEITTARSGVVLGMTMLPAVKPGEAICHIAVPADITTRQIKVKIAEDPKTLHRKVEKQLATSIKISKG